MLRILIADSQPIVRDGLRELIAGRPEWTVCGEAGDGWTALNLARREAPDLVILDVALPRLHGVALARRLMRWHPDTAVLVFTLHDEPTVVSVGLAAGVHGWVLKTDPSAEVETAIAALARGERYLSSAVSPIVKASGRGDVWPALGDTFERVRRPELRGPTNGNPLAGRWTDR